jgi:alpha-beta hydrolase superfamily lysophospholipase
MVSETGNKTFSQGITFMKSDVFSFRAPDSIEIFTYRWLPDSQSDTRAVVQIVHGMAEHAARYERFAKVLVDAGYAVYANDLRGHGKTAGSADNLGYFSDDQGWKKVVDDVHALTQIIKKENPKLPVFLFGHSMGSFVARHYAMLYGTEISGLVLSGTGGDPGLGGKIALSIGKREAKKKGKKTKSPTMDKLLFGMYNRSFRPNRTRFDWLSRDSAEVDKYVSDSFCGNIGAAGFYYDVLEGVFFVNKLENVKSIPKQLPVYFFSGTLDPVGSKTPWSGKTKGMLQAYNAMLRVGVKDVTVKLYPDGRHEMLNEINRDEVFKDVISWLDKHR